MKTKYVIFVLMLLSMMTIASAENAPSMWMEQDGNTIDLMVNTSETSSGTYAWVHFNPEVINITAVDFTGSPWQPLVEPGWSHQGDHIILSTVNFDGVQPGEYIVGELSVSCTGNGTTDISITRAEPIGVQVYNLTFDCGAPIDDSTVISIGDGTGNVTLPIIISGADNVGAVDVTLSYDPEVVMVTGITNGDMDCTYTNLEHTESGWIRVGAIQSNNPGMMGEFALLNVNLEPMGSNTECSFALTVTTFKDATPNCIPIVVTIDNGVYISSLNGDVNDDGMVDVADVSHIAKYTIGISGFGTINEDAADVNNDGEIGMDDAMILAKHVLELSGYEELR